MVSFISEKLLVEFDQITLRIAAEERPTPIFDVLISKAMVHCVYQIFREDRAYEIHELFENSVIEVNVTKIKNVQVPVPTGLDTRY